MTRPSPPRLPELAGMTEAGFNRVVAMITYKEFMPRYPFGMLLGLDIAAAEKAWSEWRASLPKVRNKRQRKAANVQRWTEEDIRKMHEPSAAIDAFFELANSVPVVDGPLAARPDLLTSPSSEWRSPSAQEMLDTLNQGIREAYEQTTKPFVPRTPLQRLQQFAADTGVPVSFEIAEAAMKGGG